MKNKSSIDEIKKAAEAFEAICEKEDVNYAIFFTELPHSLTGGPHSLPKSLPFS